MHTSYELITFGLKQFSGKANRTCRFIVFKFNRDFHLFMATQQNLYGVIIDRLRNNISKGGIGVVIALQQSRKVFPSQPQYPLRICYQDSILIFAGGHSRLITLG